MTEPQAKMSDPDEAPQAAAPAAATPTPAPASKEAVAGGLSEAVKELGPPTPWTNAVLQEVKTKRLLVYVLSTDAEDARVFARAIADKGGLLLMDASSTQDEERAVSDSALRDAIKTLIGKVGGVVVPTTSIGPADVGAPEHGIVVNVEPQAPRSRGEREYVTTPDSRVRAPLWQKMR